MSDLPTNIKAIQRAVGADVDGVFGPQTAGLVLLELNRRDGVDEPVQGLGEGMELLDERSRKNILTLDPKARDAFVEFTLLAKATAATLGCDWICIGGNRTYEEQEDLYAQGRTRPGAIVTYARGGQSNHNFGIAADYAPFQGKIYLDAGDADGGTAARRALAERVHRACSMHAKACGLEWGGSWKSLKDLPHYEVATGLTLAAKRARFEKKGSVL